MKDKTNQDVKNKIHYDLDDLLKDSFQPLDKYKIKKEPNNCVDNCSGDLIYYDVGDIYYSDKSNNSMNVQYDENELFEQEAYQGSLEYNDISNKDTLNKSLECDLDNDKIINIKSPDKMKNGKDSKNNFDYIDFKENNSNEDNVKKEDQKDEQVEKST